MERIDLPFRPHANALLAAAVVAALSGPALAAPKGTAQPLPPAVKTAPANADADASADASEDAPALAPAKGRHGSITLNFVNADIEAVSRAIGATLNREMLVDPRVKGTITVYSDKPQPVWQAYRSYLAALRGLGFTVVDAGGMLKVVPEADAKLQSAVVSVGTPKQSGDQVLTQIYHLNYENPNNLVAVLRPLITANNTINASPGNNSLIITDYADNLQRLGKIIAALDQPAGADIDIVPLKYALAPDIVQVAQRLIEGGAQPGQPGIPGQSSATSVIAEPRSNSLIVRASNGSRLAAARTIIEKLDRPVEGGGPAGNIWVVYLRNSDATRMAELLRAAIAGGTTSGTGGSSSSSTSSFGSTGNAFGGGSTPTPPQQGVNNAQSNQGGQSAAATTPVSAAARPSTGGQIQADPATNSLIISAPEPLYRQLRKVIDQLDVRRAQIYVETLIVSVDAQKQAELGIQWQGLFGGSNTGFVGGGTNFGGSSGNILNLAAAAGSVSSSGTGTTTTTSPSSLIGQGLNVGYVPKINGVYTLAALAHFLETKVGGNILSTPNLISLDNEEAKIVAGKNIGIPTGSYTASTTGSVNPFQTFDRKDVGITLRIKSQIGEGGTVRMQIFQENSDVDTSSSASTTAAFGPTTTKNSIETNVVVDDGQLMVLGGLIRDEYSDSVNAVPLLSSIPWIGNLFKSQTRTRTKSNLMVFLRPIVIRTQADADRLSVSRYDLIRAEQQEKQPEPSMFLGNINDAPVLPPSGPNGTFNKQEPIKPTGDIVK